MKDTHILLSTEETSQDSKGKPTSKGYTQTVKQRGTIQDTETNPVSETYFLLSAKEGTGQVTKSKQEHNGSME